MNKLDELEQELTKVPVDGIEYCVAVQASTLEKLIAVARAVGKLIDNSAIVGNSGEFEWSSPVEENDAVCLALDALEVADPT